MFRLMLAPLEGYTDAAFRSLCSRHGADLTFTEMAHVESFLRGNRAALRKIEVHDAAPVQIQLRTGREADLEPFLSGFEPFPGFEGFNLNLCCPSRDAISHGKGAAMVKRTSKTQRLIDVIRGRGYPVSLKISLGTNAYQSQVKVYLNCIRDTSADFYVVQAKTAAQESHEDYDYTVYPECVDAAAGKPVIANGGIATVEDVERLRESGVSGVMIGRAALVNPAVFDEIKSQLGLPNHGAASLDELRDEYLSLWKQNKGDEAHADNVLHAIGKRVEDAHY